VDMMRMNKDSLHAMKSVNKEEKTQRTEQKLVM